MEQLIQSLASFGFGGALMGIVVWLYWAQTQRLYAMVDQMRQDRVEERREFVTELKAQHELFQHVIGQQITAHAQGLKELEANFERAVDSICDKLAALAQRVDQLQHSR